MSVLVASLVAVAGLWYSGVQTRQANEQVRQAAVQAAEERALVKEGQITDRYTAAVSNLGADKLDVRLGGIYALERIMQDSPRDQPTIDNVLAAYVRTHAATPPAKGQDVPADVTAALNILATRDITHDKNFLLDLRSSRLPKVELGPSDPRHKRAGLSSDDPAWPAQGAALSGADLSGATLTSATLTGADLTGADLNSADLSGATLTSGTLTGAILLGADLSGADLSGANLDGATLADATLLGADLTGATLSGADLDGADLADATLDLVTLTSATLLGATLHRADLGGAILADADLTGADLDGADLAGADLAGADLRAANLSGVKNLTRKQVDGAFTDKKTRLPAGLK
ncbi:pentapeptide repeat-containing protein [Streptomyces sp. 150FB]|uniref:pentapeptide repeat-containing protein n=1 Tax=Streptomyces sp. 150FB TaxID=1576605 RepID=UPI001F2C111F|nr:pentapeptide repeat-containing protein [Streptomyces sp. 150FB]